MINEASNRDAPDERRGQQRESYQAGGQPSSTGGSQQKNKPSNPQQPGRNDPNERRDAPSRSGSERSRESESRSSQQQSGSQSRSSPGQSSPGQSARETRRPTETDDEEETEGTSGSQPGSTGR
jgi:hypothetical protein